MVGQSNDSTHDRDLREFLCHLLDAAYFELGPDGDGLQLRLPAFVEPPAARSPEEPTFVEMTPTRIRGCASCPDSPVSAQWIREKLLVPRCVAVDQCAVKSSQSGRAKASASSRVSRCPSAG